LKPFLLTGDVGALRFSVSNARKDLDYYGTMAAETGADRTVAQAVLESLNHAAEAEPGAMLPELVRLIAAR
jgi:3-hydroxyisobutyrate dehydrogenase-like beta-hydroxyacid dehydrogenase